MTLLRNLWGVLGGVMIIGSAFGIGWVARDILCSNFFRPLGKITFSVYLVHPLVLKTSMGNLRQPLFLSDMTIVGGKRRSVEKLSLKFFSFSWFSSLRR